MLTLGSPDLIVESFLFVLQNIHHSYDLYTVIIKKKKFKKSKWAENEVGKRQKIG